MSHAGLISFATRSAAGQLAGPGPSPGTGGGGKFLGGLSGQLGVLTSFAGTAAGLLAHLGAVGRAEELVALTDAEIKQELMWLAVNEVYEAEDLARQMTQAAGAVFNDPSVNSLSYTEAALSGMISGLDAREKVGEQRERANIALAYKADAARAGAAIDPVAAGFQVFQGGVRGFQGGLALGNAIEQQRAAGSAGEASSALGDFASEVLEAQREAARLQGEVLAMQRAWLAAQIAEIAGKMEIAPAHLKQVAGFFGRNPLLGGSRGPDPSIDFGSTFAGSLQHHRRPQQ